FFFFFQAEDGIRYFHVTGVQTCALPISDGTRTPSIRVSSPRCAPLPPTSAICARSTSSNRRTKGGIGVPPRAGGQATPAAGTGPGARRFSARKSATTARACRKSPEGLYADTGKGEQ